MKTALRIAFFCDELPPRPHGGIGVFVQKAARLLANDGYSVTLVEFGDDAEARTVEGVRYVRLRRSRARFLAWLADRLRLWLWLTNAAAADRIDYFEVPDYQGWLPLPVFSNRVTICVRLHMSEGVLATVAQRKRRLRHFVCEYLTLLFSPHWIAVSHAVLRETCRVFSLSPRHARIVPNCVSVADSECTIERGAGGMQILFVGSVTVEKGALAMARAFRLVNAVLPGAYLVYAGATNNDCPISSPQMLRTAAGAAGARIEFRGRISKAGVSKAMVEADVVALPSLSESFGLACVEAMALGKAVVFTSRGSGPEIISDRIDGRLVDPADTRALAEAIIELLRDPQQRQSMGDAARVTVRERFSDARWLERTAEMMDDRGNNQPFDSI